MDCSGAVTFTLVGTQYVGSTPGGTLLVVWCSAPGGVTGWRLTATFGVTTNTYVADNASTCTPLNLIFRNVLVDCGIINIVLSSTMGPCLPSSSSIAPGPLSSSSLSPSVSPSLSSSLSGISSGTSIIPITPGCGNEPFRTAGSVVWQDAFTDVDGTLMSAHTPTGAHSGSYVDGSTAFEIMSNQMVPNGSLPSVMLTPGGTACTMTLVFTTPANAGLLNPFHVMPRGLNQPGVELAIASNEITLIDENGTAQCSLAVAAFQDNTQYTLIVENLPSGIIVSIDGGATTVSYGTTVGNANTQWEIDGSLFGAGSYQSLTVTSP